MQDGTIAADVAVIKVDRERSFPRMEWGALVKAAAGFRCERCGATGRRLHAHHRNHDPKDNRLANGECLCVPCHSSHHRETQCVFRDPEVQRVLSRRAPLEAKARAGAASAVAHPELRLELGRQLAASTATLTADELSAKAAKGWDTRRARGGDTATYCRNGHFRTPENTGTQAGGYRLCLDCQKARA